MVDAQMDI